MPSRCISTIAIIILIASVSTVSASFFGDMNKLLQAENQQQQQQSLPFAKSSKTNNHAPSTGSYISGVVYPGISQGTTFGQSQTNAIPWTYSQKPESISSLQLWLGTGSASAVVELYSLGSVAFPNVTCYTFVPSSELDPTQKYTVVFKGVDSNGTLVSIDWVTWFGIGAGSKDGKDGIKPTACPGETAKVVPATRGSTSASKTTEIESESTFETTEAEEPSSTTTRARRTTTTKAAKATKTSQVVETGLTTAGGFDAGSNSSGVVVSKSFTIWLLCFVLVSIFC
ncbi:hypothetical protein BDR26DRAFT_865733 [Obelidium mucronatum]|nr:hypothetical protein BDR26DRAFT_865733 [Obelidium mucronatum]